MIKMAMAKKKPLKVLNIDKEKKCLKSHKDILAKKITKGKEKKIKMKIDTLGNSSADCVTSKTSGTNTFASVTPAISNETLKAINEDFGFMYPTEVQLLTLPKSLSGQNLDVASKTGSGKSLAFLIPLVEKVKNHANGTSGLVLSPTREIALQTYYVLKKLTKHLETVTHTVLIGGAKIHQERLALQKGANIIVATPGRLLDHLKHDSNCKISKLKVLVFDESDRILDEEFESELKEIISCINLKKCQVLKFAATKSLKIEKLNERLFFGSYESLDLVTGKKSTDIISNTLTQTFLVLPSFLYFSLLHKLITKKGQKMMIFFNTVDGVNLYKIVFNKMGLNVTTIHGRMGQELRTNNFDQFAASEEGILLCTDIAARGWDIPDVDLIVQYDPPINITEYVHRIGRTARKPGRKGCSLLLIRQEEENLVDYLTNVVKLKLAKFENIDLFSLDHSLQDQFIQVVKDNNLVNLAARAWFNFLTSYAVLEPKTVFNRSKLELMQLCKLFGLSRPLEFNNSRNPLSCVDRNKFRKKLNNSKKNFLSKGSKKTTQFAKRAGKLHKQAKERQRRIKKLKSQRVSDGNNSSSTKSKERIALKNTKC